jgi:hypothetical protein
MNEEKEELLKQKKEIETKLANLEKKNKVMLKDKYDVTDYECWYDYDYCLEAVKRNSFSLQYVKEQTEAICLEAVKQDGESLKYVKEQTEAICLEAVKVDGESLQYVDKRVFKLTLSKK